MTVDDYLLKISNRSNKFGSQLLKLMDEYNVIRLKDIEYNQAKDFYEKLVRENIDDSK